MSVVKLGKKSIDFLGNQVGLIINEIACRVNYNIARNFLKEHPQPEISTCEKKEINTFWREYNIKYPDYSWFVMYYGVTGVHDPRFIPDPILAKICYKYYNFESHIKGWDDKNVYERLVFNATFPYSLCHCINGKYYDNKWNYFNNNSLLHLSEKIFSELEGDIDIICKESCGSFAGRGIKKVPVNSAEEVFCFLRNHKSKNYILQRRVIQHSFFDQFNPTSANIIRVISFRHNGVINILSATIRFGIEGSFTDVAYVNGKEITNAVGIDKNGYVKDRFVSFDGNNDVNPQIKEKKVPSWINLIETVKKAHQDLLFFDFVAWDFMIDKEGSPICIEYNIWRPGTMLYQFANGPLAGEKTDSFLDFLKKSKKIPLLFRL